MAVPMCFISTPGNLVITFLLTKYYHLTTIQFGVIVSLQASCNALQLGIVPWLNRHFTSKQIAVRSSWVHWGTFMGLAAFIHFWPATPSPLTFPLLFFIFLTLAAMQAIMGISWVSWIQEFTPERIRGKYFGRRNSIFQAFTVAYLIGTGFWLEYCSKGTPTFLRDGLMAFIGLSMLLRAGSIRMIQQTYSPIDLNKHHKSNDSQNSTDWFQQLRNILKQRNLLTYFAFGASFGFTSNLMGPFFNVFMLDVLGMTAKQVTTIIVISCISGALSMSAWGRIIDRFGNRPVMAFCLVIWMVNGYLWSFVTPDCLWLLYIMWAIGGIFGAGFMQGIFGLILKIIPPESKTVAISINAAITSVPAAIAPIIAGSLLDLCFKQGWDKLTVFQYASAIHHTLVMLTVFVLLRVKEPKSLPLPHMINFMRSYRQVASILGISFFIDYLFYIKRKALS